MTLHRNCCLLAAWTIAIGAVGSAASAEEKEVALFNGKDLSGWKAVFQESRDKKAAPPKIEEVWQVREGGVLYCKGRPIGYLRTERDDFENYVLELEWRFPEGSPGGNSGVLLHTSTPNEIGVWPKSLEAQLFHQNAGDIWVIGETCEIENAAERVKGRRHLNLTDDSEKPIGEWNHYKIVCDGDQITIYVNGDKVNHVTKCSVSKGAICLQSEGAEIEFRNIKLKPLEK
jgi:hypothetical protein